MSKENIVKGAISHPVVFNAFFNDKRFLKDFLNSTGLFNIEEDSIIYLKNTMENGVDFKTSNLDVFVELINENTSLNLEMQNSKPEYDMAVRLNYYLGKMISRSVPMGNNYKKTYSIVFAIFNYTVYNDNEYLREFKFKDGFGNEIPYSKIIMLELTKSNACGKKELKNWLDIFNQKDLNQIKEEGIMGEVKKRLVELNADYEMQVLMDMHERAVMDYNSNLAAGMERAQREGMEKGIKEGMEKGMQAGIEKGMQAGIEKGMQAGMEKATLDTAKQLKLLGVSLDVIMKATGLSKEEIEKI